jgi:hypothetical protein
MIIHAHNSGLGFICIFALVLILVIATSSSKS